MPGQAPYDVVRCPAGVVRDQPDTGRCPVDFTRAMMNICISKFAIITPKKQLVKIRKIEADADSDGEKHTCSRQQKKFNSTCSFSINHPLLLKRNIIIFLYLCFLVFKSEISM